MINRYQSGSSRNDEQIPDSLDQVKSSLQTDLASRLIGDTNIESEESNREPSSSSSATVVFSDGQHNSGPSPMQVAGVARTQQNAIYTVGFGTRTEPTDLVLLDAEYPDTVHKYDQVRGSLVLKDRMREGLPYVVQIRDGDSVVWQEELKSLNVAQRRVEFDFAAEPLVDSATERFDINVQHHSLPIDLTATIVPVEGETETSNNSKSLRFAAITQRQKLMLIDSRSRWETRYLKNLFERDSSWQINPIILESGVGDGRLQRGDSEGMFPASREALFEYDFIVYGDVAASNFNTTELGWLRDFVDKRGGGIIFVDGVRGELRRLNRDTLGVLLPVESISESEPQKVDRLELADFGSSLSALAFQSLGTENDQFWQALPAPHRVFPVKVLPGAEVWAEAVV